MPEWIIYVLGGVGALQSLRILEAIINYINAQVKRTKLQAEATEAAIEYQNLVIAAQQEEKSTHSFGNN